jgi:hypothetical protein
MLEALILWQVVQARRDINRQERLAGQDVLTVLLFIQFLITMFIWPVNATYRLGLWRLNKAVAISVACLVMIFLGIGATAIYLLVGIVWGGFEAAAWISKNAEIERSRM